jgi:hypothetical protein
MVPEPVPERLGDMWRTYGGHAIEVRYRARDT